MKIKIAVMMCAALGLPGVIFGQHHAPPATPTAEQSITGDWVIHFQAGHESVSGAYIFRRMVNGSPARLRLVILDREQLKMESGASKNSRRLWFSKNMSRLSWKAS